MGKPSEPPEHYVYSDVNRVTLTGRARTPEMRLIPPGTTLYLLIPLVVRGLWPDHTGQVASIHYEITCFAQGPAAEQFIWVLEHDLVKVYGAIDFIVGEFVPGQRELSCVQSIRVADLTLLQRGGII